MREQTTRRRILQGIGTGLVGTTLATNASAQRGERLFVHPEDGSGEEDTADAVEEVAGEILYTYDNFPFVAAAVPENRVRDVANDDRVRKVEREGQVRLHRRHGRERGPPCHRHSSQRNPWGYDRIGADTANEEVTGQGVNVAIIDSGIQSDHCDFEGEIESGVVCNFRGRPTTDDQHGHGTMSAGVVGARDNDLGVVGVAPDSRLHPVKSFNAWGANDSDVLCGIDWTITNEVEILSMSFGGEAETDAVDIALDTAYENGHLLVASAGNASNNRDGNCEEDNVREWPAAHPNVIAVSAMDRPGTSRYETYPLAAFSSVGPEVELMAPGVQVETTDKVNSYSYYSGTSAACPHVSGAAALGWDVLDSSGPDVTTRDRVREALRNSAEEVLGSCEEGYGLVRADHLLDELR